MIKLPAVLAALLSLVALGGCGGSGGSSSSAPSSSAAAPYSSSTTQTAASQSMPAAVRISSRSISGLGPVLVNSQGRTLYVFAPDKHARVTCVSACAVVWPPVKLAAGAKPLAGAQVKQTLLGSDPDPAGGKVVTYAGWPLYTYVTDTAAGSARGQSLNLNGGLWYVIAPSGTVIRKKS